MNTVAVFDKYKHLDGLLSDRDWLPDGFVGEITFDLWQAIKATQPNGKQKRSYSVVKPKEHGSRDERIVWALDRIIRNRTSSAVAISTAEIDRRLTTVPYHFQYVGSLSKKLSNLRQYWRSEGIGELRRFDKYAGNKRVCYYFLEKAGA